MATHKSSKKRARQAIKRRERNRNYVASVRKAIKQFKSAVASGEGKEALTTLFTTAQSALAKAAQKGLIHSNNASRRIGRLSATLGKVSSEDTATTEKPTKKAPAKKSSAAAKKAPAKAKAKAAPKKKAAKKK